MLKVRMHVAGNKQIDAAVAVVIGPGGAGPEATHLEACAFGHIFESAPTQVVIQHVMSVAGDIEIRQAIVVEICDGNCHPPPARGESRSRRNVGEMEGAATSILAIQRDHRVAAGQEALDCGVVDSSNVEPAGVVAVEEGGTPPPIVSTM